MSVTGAAMTEMKPSEPGSEGTRGGVRPCCEYCDCAIQHAKDDRRIAELERIITVRDDYDTVFACMKDLERQLKEAKETIDNYKISVEGYFHHQEKLEHQLAQEKQLNADLMKSSKSCVALMNENSFLQEELAQEKQRNSELVTKCHQLEEQLKNREKQGH